MIEPTLEQLRTLAAVVEHGSFSAAARELGRAQSAVSTAMANLEQDLGVPLWDRSRRTATLTAHGASVLAAARRVLGEADQLRELARDLGRGVEPSVSLCVEALFPLTALVAMCRAFARELPAVDLRVDVQTMNEVAHRVLDGRATIGVATSLAQARELDRLPLTPIRMLAVVGRDHALAGHRGPIPAAKLRDQVQIVLSEQGAAATPDQAVLSTRTWRVHDLTTKRELLRAGLGWGNLPEHLARADLRRGTLVEIRPAAWSRDEHTLQLAVIHRADRALGPAHRWVVDQLVALCVKELG